MTKRNVLKTILIVHQQIYFSETLDDYGCILRYFIITDILFLAPCNFNLLMRNSSLSKIKTNSRVQFIWHD